jgi:hypothetical protein
MITKVCEKRAYEELAIFGTKTFKIKNPNNFFI